MREPMHIICAAHNTHAPPPLYTFIVPQRTWDYAQVGHIRISMIIRNPNGLARLEVTRRGVCVIVSVGMTMIELAHGCVWYWLVDGERHRKAWLLPGSDRLRVRPPYRVNITTPLELAHVRLVDLYRHFGIVWTGDQSLPAKPYRMTIARYDKLIGKIREQWAVLSGR